MFERNPTAKLGDKVPGTAAGQANRRVCAASLGGFTAEAAHVQ